MNLRIDHWDITGAVGVLLLIAGLAWAWPPLALIGIGAALCGVGLCGARGGIPAHSHTSTPPAQVDDLDT